MLKLSLTDKAVLHFDKLLGLNSKQQFHAIRHNPSANVHNPEPLNETERKQSIAMMRINHSGEVCAQALYKGQALTAKSAHQYESLLRSAAEETDHLAWCKQRLIELNGKTSLLNPVWYAGSFSIGALVGLAGDKFSLGFICETEYQVTKHIDGHLIKMSHKDQKSRAVLEQMRVDEMQHATVAEQAGGSSLPMPIKILMKLTAKIMTNTAEKI